MEHYQPKNVLITGGAGFIGSRFIRYLLQHYSQVNIVNLDALTYAGNRDNIAHLPDPGRHQLLVGDIGDKACVRACLRTHDIDTIVHFAAETHVDRSISNPEVFVQTNVMGTLCLLHAAQAFWIDERHLSTRQCRFHHISTDEVFGQLDLSDPPFTEQSPYQPSSPYSASKAAADHLLRAFHHTYGLPVTISHCSNNYGPYQHEEKLIPTVIKRCLAQEPIPVYGSGENIRDWIFVDDHCRLLDRVIRCGTVGQSYNIGANNEQTNIAVVQHICQIMEQIKPCGKPYSDLIEHVTDRKGHDFRYAIDASKLTQLCPDIACRDFVQGLMETVQWYLEAADSSTILAVGH